MNTDTKVKVEKLVEVNHKRDYLIWGTIIIIVPLVIAVGTSLDIMNWATNDNDWIGFWGGYVGTLLGGVITLFVMFRSLADSKKTLQETLSNEKYIQERNEVFAFGNLLIEKSALYSMEIEEMMYKAHYCVIQQEETQKVDMERVNDCLREIRIARSVLIEISMHLEIIADKKAYCCETGIKLTETVEALIELVKKYKNLFLQNRLDDEVEKEIYELSNKLFEQTQGYLKEIG